MNGMLPENLRIPVPADPEVAEDFRELLEKVIEQNAEILARLDDDKPSAGPATFWDGLFSFYGAIIIIVVSGALAAIFAN